MEHSNHCVCDICAEKAANGELKPCPGCDTCKHIFSFCALCDALILPDEEESFCDKKLCKNCAKTVF